MSFIINPPNLSAYLPLAGGTMTGALTLPAGTAGSPTLDFTGSGIFKNYANTLSISAGGEERLLVTADAVLSTALVFSLYPDTSALAFGTASDIKIFRDAAATLAQRNGTTQQIFRLYNTYTDSSNYERLTLTGVAGTSVNITAETLGTGGDNIDIVLTPAGTGSVKFPSGASVDSSGVVTGAAFVTASAGYFGGVVIGHPSSDAALLRGSAGQIDVTNGTANTYRDLKLRNLITNPGTFAALVAAATAGKGARAFINDGAGAVFGVAAAGGGALNVPVYSDGTNWIVG